MTMQLFSVRSQSSGKPDHPGRFMLFCRRLALPPQHPHVLCAAVICLLPTCRMDSENDLDAVRMSVDEGAVASTSTSSADATAPDGNSDQVAANQDSNTSSQSIPGADEPVSSSSTAPFSGITPEDAASETPAAPAKSEPEIRVWKPLAPGTMPKPRMSYFPVFSSLLFPS